MDWRVIPSIATKSRSYFNLSRPHPNPKRSHPCGTLDPASCLAEEHPIVVRTLRNYLRFLVAVQLLPALESGEELWSAAKPCSKA